MAEIDIEAPGADEAELKAAFQALVADAIADAVAALVDSSPGTLNTLNELAAALGDDANFASTVTAALASKAAASQTKEMLAGFIASPSDKSYTIALKMTHSGTITETVTKSASGTCTATFKINSTALGGTANSVSSSEQSQSHSSSNTFAAGDDVVLTISSNSSCTDMSFSIKYTRTLD